MWTLTLFILICILVPALVFIMNREHVARLHAEIRSLRERLDTLEKGRENPARAWKLSSHLWSPQNFALPFFDSPKKKE
jgi:hypothetical protein